MTERIGAEIVIMGGGLAGLTLAIHLRQRYPELSVHVIERREHPVREAAFKVGESTVEIGAHYLSEVLGLREHLDRCHLRKFGFRFFFSDRRKDIDRCLEIGVSRVLPTPSWQIDRGRLENHLGEQARSLGVRFDTSTVVRKIEMGIDAAPHVVEVERNGQRERVPARWLIDASGRAGLLKRKLGLARANQHEANAVWWRVAGHIDPNEWSDNTEWRERCDPPDRWRSTNHMCGPGYWVWLIPLASGSHSIGIVCDADMHALERMNSPDKAMQWLQLHQPRIAQALAEEKHVLQDFNYLRNYSYDCAQVLSGQRWAITGEAGCFLDPFYSPGTDFIAIANTFIVDLIGRDLNGDCIEIRTQFYQQLFASFHENMLTLYQSQYKLFGDAQVMPVKVIWDYTYYWALLAPLFLSDRLTDIPTISSLRSEFAQGRELNGRMQKLFSEWSCRRQQRTTGAEQLLDQYRIEWFRKMNSALTARCDEQEFRTRISRNLNHMRCLAKEIGRYAIGQADTSHMQSGSRGAFSLEKQFPALLPAEWYGHEH